MVLRIPTKHRIPTQTTAYHTTPCLYTNFTSQDRWSYACSKFICWKTLHSEKFCTLRNIGRTRAREMSCSALGDGRSTVFGCTDQKDLSPSRQRESERAEYFNTLFKESPKVPPLLRNRTVTCFQQNKQGKECDHIPIERPPGQISYGSPGPHLHWESNATLKQPVSASIAGSSLSHTSNVYLHMGKLAERDTTSQTSRCKEQKHMAGT